MTDRLSLSLYTRNINAFSIISFRRFRILSPPPLTPPVASSNPDARMQPDHASLRDDINPNGCYSASIYSGSSRNRSFVSAVLLPPSLSLFASSPFPLVTHRNLTHEWTSRDLYLYQSVKVPHPLLILFCLAGNMREIKTRTLNRTDVMPIKIILIIRRKLIYILDLMGAHNLSPI